MFSVTVDGVTEEIFSVEELKADITAEMVLYSNEVLRAEQKEGFPEKFNTLVDGRSNKSVLDVNLGGKIEFINLSQDLREKILMAFDEIDKRSPSGTKFKGDKHSNVKYRNYNYVYFNRKLVAENRLGLIRFLNFAIEKGFSRGDSISFVNVVPYARKLERFGVTAGNGRFNTAKGGRAHKKSGKFSLPNGVYYQAQRSMKSILKGRAFVAPVKFEPLDVKISGMRNTFKKSGEVYLYPVIKILPFVEGGLVQ